MVPDAALREAVARLKAALAELRKSPNKEYEKTWAAKEEVVARYAPIFSLDHVPHITEEEFHSFLLFKNNRHWVGLHRQGPRMTEDMDLLQDALSILFDDERPMKQRLNTLISSSGSMVPGLGRATITAMLLVKYPNEYSVWNATSEAGMRELGVWPDFERGSSFGDRYLKMNRVLNRLSEELELDLWDLDTLWWLILDQDDDEKMPTIQPDDADILAQRFGLERYLQEFLRDNWPRISLFKGWTLYEEDGEEVGFEYFTDIGRIDLLAKHKSDPKWLVIELKRGQSSDETVGQVLRYMGWVEQNLALRNEEVMGAIISRTADERMSYALRNTKNVDLWFYEVEFHLNQSVEQ